MSKGTFVLVFAFALLGCGGGADTPKAHNSPSAAPKTAVKPADESVRFPGKNRVDVKVMDDHLLGKEFLPGGNLATYRKGNKEYQLFLIKAQNASEPALWLLDLKKQMVGAKLVAGFGGYFGQDGGKPLFAFTKNRYLAGVVGLPESEADAVSREFAVRIP